MVVEQNPRKKPRPPMATLWAIVQRIGDAHWAQLRLQSRRWGKNSMFFKLMEFLREMPAYDPEAEKAEFAAKCNLGALRNISRKWLVQHAVKLELQVERQASDVVGVDVLISWGCTDEALRLLQDARNLATRQRDHGRLTELYEQEIALVKTIFKGEDRLEKMTSLAKLALESSQLHSLEAEIRIQKILHIEIQKVRFETFGTFDLQATARYFKSEFHKRKIDGWPIGCQIDKLIIDEWNHVVRLDVAKAIEVASRILDIFEANEATRAIRARDHARVLLRMCVSKPTKGNGRNAVKALDSFRAVKPTAPENRDAYLVFFLQSMFMVGYDTENMALAAEGAAIWEEQKAYLGSLPTDMYSILNMLCVCSYFVATGRISEARTVFNDLFRVQDAIQPISARAVYMVLHIIILVEEVDDVELKGLQSYSKSYKRELKGLEAGRLGLELLDLLCKPKHNFKPKSLLKTLPKVMELLTLHQNSEEVSYKPFLYPIIYWATRKMLTLK